jgi:hypothetical protein
VVSNKNDQEENRVDHLVRKIQGLVKMPEEDRQRTVVVTLAIIKLLHHGRNNRMATVAQEMRLKDNN